MTFNEIVAATMERLNLTSPEAQARIGRFVNARYKRVTSGIGLQTSRRTTVNVTVDPTDPESTLPEYTVENLEKILKITMTAGAGGILVLKEKMYDEITVMATNNRFPRAWAPKRMGLGTVTIVFDSFPPDQTFDLKIEGYQIPETLEDDQEPFLPTDFHDLLIEGAMSDELRKMEKPQLAAISENTYNERLSDLRMFIAKSAFLDIAQGKDKPGQLWYRPWYSRVSIWN